MDTQKEIVQRLKQANNVLVTVSNDPTVDQLAACLGLSLALNKLDKHAAAIYSGKTPSTIEFLDPGTAFEKTTDSLRDFIISLDKSKADKLRYKVEDDVVRIFITPYRASISEQDLQFGQGDFNVDVVVAIGVHEQHELDQAVTLHGRILHDATVIALNTQPGPDLGEINWLNESASGLSEMVTEIVTQLDDDMLDEQTATALLTGIVAETDRFSNEKTSANTMKLSATLMAAGANQQLVSTKLEEPLQPEAPEPAQQQPYEGDDYSEQDDKHNKLSQVAVNEDGTLEISHPHEEPKKPAEPALPQTPEPAPAPTPDPLPPMSDLLDESDFHLPSVPTDDSGLTAAEEALLSPQLPPEQPLPEIKKDKRTLLPNVEPEPELGITPADPGSPTAQAAPAQPPAIKNRILNHDILGTSDEPPKLSNVDSIESAFELPPVDTTYVSPNPPTPPNPVTPPAPATPPQGATLEDLERQFARPAPAPQSQPAPQPYQGPSPQVLDSARSAVTDAMNQRDATASPVSFTNVQPTAAPVSNPGIQSPLNPAMSQPQPIQQQPMQQQPQPTAEQPVTMPLPQVVMPSAQPAPASVGVIDQNYAPPVPPPIMPPFNNGR